jgi:hypothetical protein
MKSRRKLIAGILLVTMVFTGVLAATVSADDESAVSPQGTLMARVAELLGLNQSDVENAFQQAMTEQREERQANASAARDTRLQELIDQGVVTQEQIDEFESWLSARPDNREAMQEWMESRPDFGDKFPGLAGRAAAGGMRGMRGGMMPFGPRAGQGFAGLCPALESAD